MVTDLGGCHGTKPSGAPCTLHLAPSRIAPMRLVPLLAMLALAPLASEQSFTGQISDSLCKAKHEEAAEDQGKMSDHDCTVACVKGGSKYVLLGSDGKVYDIANQD